MSRQLFGRAGSEQAACRARTHRPIAFVELITIAALALSTAVAVTTVSFVIARADVVGALAKGDGASFAIALLIGLLISAMGGLTAIAAGGPPGD